MTMTRLPRLITLHFSHMRLTDARTFIAQLPSGSPESIRDAPSGWIVGRELHLHPVARQNADEVDPHLAGDVCQNLVSGRQFHPEHGVGKHLDDGPFDLNDVFLGHPLPRGRTTHHYTGASAGSLVRTSQPPSVTATVCSKWADGRPSAVRTVQPSRSTTTSDPPMLTIGSIASVIPGRSTSPAPRRPKLGTCGSSCSRRPTPCPA